MHPRHLRLASFVTTLVLSTSWPALGQTTPIIRLTPASGSSVPATSMTAATATQVATPPGLPELPSEVFASPKESETAAGTADAKRAQRLQKIQQLTFDRRPSTILKAWATPEGETEDEPAKTSTSSTRPATPTVTLPAGLGNLPEKERAALLERLSGASASTSASSTSTPDPFDKELKSFQRMVTLGDWPKVKEYLAKLPEEEGKALHRRLVQNLPATVSAGARTMVMEEYSSMTGGGVRTVMPQMAMVAEKNAISGGDVIALADAAPKGLDAPLLDALGRLLRASIDQGNAVEDVVGAFQAALKDQDRAKGFPLTRREAAKLLIGANAAVEAGAFLPSPEKAEAENDREALNLLSRHYLALHAKEKKAEHLERAWTVTQAALADGEVDRADKDEALTRAVELAVKVREELGLSWLEESFTKRPERGMEIIAAIGSAASQGLQTQPMNPEFRKRSLDLQKTAVEALLKASPERASSWAPRLGLLATSWLAEADFSQRFDTSTSLGPRMSRDVYGNIFYLNDPTSNVNLPRNPNMPRAIPVAEVLEARPGEDWVALLDPALKPRYASACSQLYLKVGEDALAFPFVERLAQTHPEKARSLAEEFIRVWTDNHDPNAQRNRTSPYIYMFGFERKAEGIPLTRSKQERNLVDLSNWVRRLRALPIGDLDESLLARAFTTCHSEAEVYRVEAIESVFGSLDALKPETLAELAQRMRTNLLSVWRQPAAQERNQTRRKEKDIRAEVLRGYEVARATVESGLRKYPDHWALELARAAVLHDENNYRQELDPSTRFTKNRAEAMGLFRRAADRYAKAAASLPEERETAQAFEQWFYASLGACDLSAIDPATLPDVKQPALIREAILSLPGPAAERHLSRFANALFTRMSGLNPAVKFRYLKGGFEIAGDHKQAHEAKKVYDYYKDLVTEITLETAVDGGTTVGHGKPFGLFVNLRHTREIERESGGFGRYLQNQNSGNMFYYNYGRPLENYRDKFQDAATKALQDQFDVLSVTFQDEKVTSKASAEYGWRVTPYAYVLLKVKSPEVDKIPPLRLDLDFLDTSGYVVLPVESPVVPIDAGPVSPPARPSDQLVITQTLDERQAEIGKLVLEVKAVGRGLVPEFDQILDLDTPGFRVTKTEDQGLSVSKFDPEADQTAVLSERGWLITLEADGSRANPPSSFTFARPRVDDAKLIHQRYVDADLVAVPAVVDLEERYGASRRTWLVPVLGGASLLTAAAALVWWYRPRRTVVETSRYLLPETLTPFNVLGLLREIDRDDALSPEKKTELAASIDRLERYYFAQNPGEAPDLHALARDWIGQTA
ncbi:MAG: hypothetical protein AB7I30_02680 [Isosphaeraceae bacterium]